MLLEHTPEAKDFEKYKQFLTKEQLKYFKESTKELKGKKIVHINATPVGGGVAEILKSLVPLQKSIGLDSHWFYLKGEERLFEITKKMHNSLQGSEDVLTDEEKEFYLEHNKGIAKAIDDLDVDILMIHDPQPLASIKYLKKNVPSTARIHIDLTKPNKDSLDFIHPFLSEYDKMIFSLPEYVNEELEQEKVIISPPAIDPLSVKNAPLSDDAAKTILVDTGINPTKHLITQVSRFDPWKDPLGVIKAYYEVKNEIPDVQLVLAGVMEAKDDPEAIEVFEHVEKEAKGDPDIFLISDPEQLKEVSMDVFINTLQTESDVIMQKSIREGFGLTVTEAMWKGKPVIGGNVGGIKIQIKDGENGFLVDSPEEAAQHTIELLNDKKLAAEIGKKAKKSVEKNFLITRYMKDEFDIMKNVLQVRA